MPVNILIIVIVGMAGVLPLFLLKYHWLSQLCAGCGIAAYTGLLIFMFPDNSPWILGVICGAVGWIFGGLIHFFFREKNLAALLCSALGLLLGTIAFIVV